MSKKPSCFLRLWILPDRLAAEGTSVEVPLCSPPRDLRRAQVRLEQGCAYHLPTERIDFHHDDPKIPTSKPHDHSGGLLRNAAPAGEACRKRELVLVGEIVTQSKIAANAAGRLAESSDPIMAQTAQYAHNVYYVKSNI